MTRTLLTGATGRLGSVLRPRLAAAGHEVRAASRSPPGPDDGTNDDGTSADGQANDDGTNDDGQANDDGTSDEGGGSDIEWVRTDLAAGEGVESAVAGVDVVVHAASAPTGDTEAVDVEGTERLLAAAADAGVENFVYTSVVGIENIPFGYYEHKLAAEEAIADSEVPSTIVRATQFHSFVDEILGSVARLPVWPLPTRMRVQPVDAREYADALVEYATTDASGRTPPVGGPAVLTLGELARAYRSARGLRRPVVRLPLPVGVVRAFRAGEATCPDRAVGTVTWEDWLAEQYGDGTGRTASAAESPTSPTETSD